MIADPSELVAVSTSERVASEPDDSPAPVRVRVPFVHTSEARVPKPVSVRVPLAQTSAASEPNVVSERVPLVQMSETSVPKEVRVLPENAHIEFGRVAESEEEAEVTALFVLAFTSAATDDEETILSVISKVLSAFTRLPFTADPHDIIEGHTPTTLAGVKEYEYQLLALAVIEAAFTARTPEGL